MTEMDGFPLENRTAGGSLLKSIRKGYITSEIGPGPDNSETIFSPAPDRIGIRNETRKEK
jgi:hypothetical protein